MSLTTSAPKFPEVPKYVTQLRHVKDKGAAWLIAAGGGSVIAAIALIFIYLLYEVVPLFKPATMALVSSHAIEFPQFNAEDEQFSIQSGLDELGEVLYFRDQEGYRFIRFDGQEIDRGTFPNRSQMVVSSTKVGSTAFGVVDTNHQVNLYEAQFKVVFPVDGDRFVQPSIESVGDASLSLDLPNDAAVIEASYRLVEDTLLWASLIQHDSVQLLVIQTWSVNQSIFDDGLTFDSIDTEHYEVPTGGIKKLLIGPDLRWVYALENQGGVSIYDRNEAKKSPSHRHFVENANISAINFLLGANSILLGDSQGSVSQLSPIRDSNNDYHFSVLRQFDLSDEPIVTIRPEHRRKGFAAVDAKGSLFLVNTTAHRVALTQALDQHNALYTLSPRADLLASINADGLNYYEIHNEHPEISWKSLWREVWYEGYEEPKYLWQSSAANNDFEPKLSLVPLSLGTLKAAFYAMLFAMPLAICSAIYTAYFMAPGLRRKVKPAIELMEALPTVILGFLAGLWLAPLIESYLPGVFVFLCVTPVMFLLTAFLLSRLPASRSRLLAPAGWEPLTLIPILLLSVFISFSLSHPLQDFLFGGDVRIWLEQDLGITYDQRNALVVGFAMGFAVIPTIFSITEDAVFSVPKSLTQSSLALGASPWQTLVRVILPTASPGIFSAVMIGFGRAVGETMIVLMATGNTPIMNFNIFEGFRTLSANIAVELPEAEVHSTHFRVLFLSALVLFIFTFLINTTAEFVRQRLREKYGRL